VLYILDFLLAHRRCAIQWHVSSNRRVYSKNAA